MIPTIDEASDVALDFARDRWLWFKILAWAAIGWLLLLPTAWKVILLVVSSLLKTFLVRHCLPRPSPTRLERRCDGNTLRAA